MRREVKKEFQSTDPPMHNIIDNWLQSQQPLILLLAKFGSFILTKPCPTTEQEINIASSTNIGTYTIISIHLDLNEIQILRSKDSDFYFNTGVIFFIFILCIRYSQGG